MIQIVCTFITFLGAGALLALNQWFVARHKQTETLSEKLEELYTVIERIASLGMPVTSDRDSLSEISEKMRNNAVAAIKECKRASLLISLYFPQLTARWNSLLEDAEAGFYEMAEFRDGVLFDYIWDKITDNQQHISIFLDHLTCNSKDLTKRVFE